jgi:hypothetical protein
VDDDRTIQDRTQRLSTSHESERQCGVEDGRQTTDIAGFFKQMKGKAARILWICYRAFLARILEGGKGNDTNWQTDKRHIVQWAGIFAGRERTRDAL